MSPLLPLPAGMAQIAINFFCFFVATCKEVKANIHHEILEKHLVSWTNRSMIFHWHERFNGNVKKDILGTLLVNCIFQQSGRCIVCMPYLNLLDVHIWCDMQDEGQAMPYVSLAPLNASDST
jgi:hypothetical protein